MASQTSLRDHVSTAILDAAASVLSERGGAASMGDVAEAAGVARATLYRYFPTRGHLLRALAQAALEDAGRRLKEADLDSVPVAEALARMTRAMVACTTKYAVLVADRTHVDPDEVECKLGAPTAAVFDRGVEDGTLRSDLAPGMLSKLYGGLLQAAVRMTVEDAVGVERASAAVVSLFLEGARGRSPDRVVGTG